jgi:hypothetical protein
MLHRRDAMLRLGQLGCGAVALPHLLCVESAHAAQRSSGGRAKSVILLFLWGGPPQNDMWDLKPEAPEGIRTIFRPIQTRVPGVHFCDQLPLLARHTDKLALIRSMSHPSNVHGSAPSSPR